VGKKAPILESGQSGFFCCRREDPQGKLVYQVKSQRMEERGISIQVVRIKSGVQEFTKELSSNSLVVNEEGGLEH